MVRPFFTPPPREAASIEREEFYLELILQINSFINGIVWGPIMLFLLVGTGVYLTVRCGCLQARKFGFMLRSTLGSLFRKTDKASGGQNLTPFQAVSTALAGTVGTGNIAGVTGAIFAGGPGAVFWMWVSAFFGMMTKYAEIVLAVKYRQVDGDGTHFGGPMYYIEKGTGHKWLAVLFALLGGVACFGIGNIAQSTEIAGAMQSLVGLPPLYTGILLAILTAFVVIGGGPLYGHLLHRGGRGRHPAAHHRRPRRPGLHLHRGVQLPGGGRRRVRLRHSGGYAPGLRLFSNEAGLGSAPMAHAASNTKEPVEQGLWGIFEVFVDTIIICTLTSMAVLLSGVLENDINSYGSNGAAAAAAFNAILPGTIGGTVLQISLLFFALSTILGWSYYGERCWGYLTHNSKIANLIFKVAFVLVCVVGAVGSGSLMWDISDTLNGMMAIPNLIGLLLLSGTVVQLTRTYFKDK